MGASDRIQEYLAKAQQAEEYAVHSSDATLRTSWLRIAESYRDLANFVRGKEGGDISWQAAMASRDENLPLHRN